MRKKYTGIGVILALFFCFFIYIYLTSEYHAVFSGGIMYIERSDNYMMQTTILDEIVSFELDWENIYDYVGTVIYNDSSGCRICISNIIDDGNGGYKIAFEAQGRYDYSKAQLVTILAHDFNYDDGIFASTVGENRYTAQNWYVGAKSVEKFGDIFGYSIFPKECYEMGELIITDLINKEDNKVTIELSGLQKIQWERNDSRK